MTIFNKKSRIGQNTKFYCISIMIPMIIIVGCNGIPLLQTFIKSFFNWDGLFTNKFIALNNYIKIFQDRIFWLLLKNSLIVFIYIPVVIIIGIFVATLIFYGFKGSKSFLYTIYIPQILSTIVVGKVFNLYFGLDGPINKLLDMLGFDKIYWHGNIFYSFMIIILCVVWLSFGWQTLLFTGAFSSIDKNISELALIDGCGFIKSIFLIYIPLIKMTILYSFSINLIFGFTGFFPIIFVLTYGGPGYNTTTLDFMIYIKSFGSEGNLGEAYALSIIMLAIVLALVFMLYIAFARISNNNLAKSSNSCKN
ncbi:multiple sugar transport system permease protein/raffinose/stachyose/melibiose transport system permease protein [Anaerobacterium chartisolvens]|uniref:Multiple sugar transport system permease protein/raffinose/stachyose/melibiose transport system permease protein n=1 Tax=Anaerobacterium chartisolvens TaxID=1297424 RepID=A0A369AP59_9FIRM|nr:sugar ABC transporter permease [Anaerobacterium chartisolvens]RCX11152.1 multiple sugar transport system permease protein/raffinose/stachyose/melibiose transport system permease protein [Anaerobacterium chartisolvens]